MMAFSKSDHAYAAALGVALDGGDLKMDDLHRTHIARLRAELAQDQKLFDSWALDMIAMRTRKGLWKLFAFAGWFVAFLFIVRDLIGGKA
jgi:hypothetical protein